MRRNEPGRFNAPMRRPVISWHAHSSTLPRRGLRVARAIVPRRRSKPVSTDRRELDDDNSPRSLGSEDVADVELQDLAEVEDEELDDETADAADDSGTDDDGTNNDSEQASLEELLAQRAAVRPGAGDSDEDSDNMALASEP